MGAGTTKYLYQLAGQSSADLHERVNDEVQLESVTYCTRRCSQRSTWSRKLTLVAGASSGILTWNRQQAAERSAGAVLSRAPWTIKVVAQGRGQHRDGEERTLMLAEVQCRFANRNVAVFKADLNGRTVTFESREHAGKEGHLICSLCMRSTKQNTTECHEVVLSLG